MDKQQYKLEKLKLRVDQEREAVRAMGDFLQNPLVEYALGVLFIGYITRGSQSVLERLTGIDIMAGAWGATLTSIIMAQQLGKSLPYLTDSALKLLPGLGVLK